eukprot:g1127.t1
MDLHSETNDVDLSGYNLDEILKQCLCVKQDLTYANQTIATSSAKTKKYPVRKRPTGQSNEQPIGSSRTNKKKTRNGDVSKKSVQPHISRPELLDTRTKERSSRIDLVSEDEARDEIILESETEAWNTEFEIPAVGLDQVIAAFKTWNNSLESSEITSQSFTQSPPFLSTKLVLSPYDSETWSLPESSKVPKIDLGGPPEKKTGDLMMTEDHQKTPVGMESSTLPSGYSLQSLQLVLETEMEQDTNREVPSLTPLFEPESYTVPSSLTSFIPIWRAPLKWIQKPVNIDFTTSIEMELAAPLIERVDPDELTFRINVTEFLARMNRKCSNIHPMIVPPSLDTDTLTDEIDHLFMHLLSWQPLPESSRFQVHDVRSSRRDKVGDSGGSGLTDEDRLRALSKKLENMYNPVEKNELSKLISTKDC